MQLKSLVFALRQHLVGQSGIKPSVGHTYELLAALFGYESFASLNSQAFIVLLNGSDANAIVNVRLWLAGHPDIDRTIQRHQVLKAAGDSRMVATAMHGYAQQHELVAIPVASLVEYYSQDIAVDQWTRIALDELLAAFMNVANPQRQLTLGMLENACTSNRDLHYPLLQIYQRLAERVAGEDDLALTFKERVKFHLNSSIAAGSGVASRHGAKDDKGQSPTAVIAEGAPKIDLWAADYRSAHAVIQCASVELRRFAATQLLEISSAQTPHTIWATDDGTLGHLVEMGFTEVRLDLNHYSPIGRVCINPFWAPPGGSYARHENLLGITQLLHLMVSEVDPDLSISDQHLESILYEAISDFYRERERHEVSNEPTMSAFIETLRKFKWKGFEGYVLAEALADFYGTGLFAGLFDGPLSFGTKADQIIFNTSDLKGSPALAPAVLALAMRLDDMCRYSLKRAERKVFLMGHDWMEHTNIGFTAPFSRLYKSFRRYNLSVQVLSEDLTAYHSLQEGHPVSEMEDGLLMNTSHSFAVKSRDGGLVMDHDVFEFKGTL